MADFFGPADAANAVTIRPADSRSFPSNDTFWRNCSSPTAEDGTDITAEALNTFAATLRNVVRMNGALAADPTQKIIAEVGNDDTMLVKSIQHLLQRMQPQFGSDTGTANNIILTLSPVPREYKAGMCVRPKIAFDVTGPTQINVNGLGWVPVVRPDGRPLVDGDMVKNMLPELVFDGSSFQLIGGGVKQLSAPLTYYVNGTTGSDTNAGTSSQPFKTIQRAIDVSSSFDANNFTVRINVADGSYASFVAGASLMRGFGRVEIIGNLANPAAVTISSSTGICCYFIGTQRTYVLGGVKVVATSTSGNGCGILADPGVQLGVYNMDFGYCAAYHIWSSRSMITLLGPADGVGASFINISGSAGYHIRASEGGVVGSRGPTLNITAAVTFFGFISLEMISHTTFTNTANFYAAINNPGNVTAGVKFSISGNSIANMNGAGINYFPGPSAGVVSSGGQYY